MPSSFPSARSSWLTFLRQPGRQPCKLRICTKRKKHRQSFDYQCFFVVGVTRLATSHTSYASLRLSTSSLFIGLQVEPKAAEPRVFVQPLVWIRLPRYEPFKMALRSVIVGWWGDFQVEPKVPVRARTFIFIPPRP